MAIISQETIDNVNQSSDIVSVISEYVQLERRGAQWWGCCPFHSEKTPSFSVTPEKNMYYCFGCHEGGNVVRFVMEMEKMKFPEAVQYLAKKANVEIKYVDGKFDDSERKVDNSKELYIELYNRVAGTFHYLLTQTESGKFALDYIKKRGLSMETIEKFKLGYAPSDRLWLKKFLKSKNFTDEFLQKSGLFSEKYPDIAFFSDRLMFPIFDRRGQVVAFSGRFLRGDPQKSPKYINSKDLIQFKKGETLFAFNFAKTSIHAEKKVIICEGQMDCIAYHQCGINYAVAPGGTALTEEQIKLVKGYAKTILLSFDSDNAGQNATYRAILMCRAQDLEVRVISIEDGKDPAEIMNKFGPEKLTVAVNNAKLDNEHILTFLAQKYALSTPEGKTRIALEFFPYIDSLQSEIQKETNLERLSEFLGISLDFIRKDFLNREQAVNRVQIKRSDESEDDIQIHKKDAELRVMLAAITDTKFFTLLHEELAENDLETPAAKKLFSIMEDCFQRDCLSQENILSNCDNHNFQKVIVESIHSKEFCGDTERIIKDGVHFIKRRSLEKQRNFLLDEMKRCNTDTSEGKMIFDELFVKKLDIDQKLKGKG